MHNLIGLLMGFISRYRTSFQINQQYQQQQFYMQKTQSDEEYESQESIQIKKPPLNKKKTPIALKQQPPKPIQKQKIIINLSDCQYPVVRSVAKKLKWKINADSEATQWDVWWTDNAVAPEVLFKMQPHQKINHFPGMYILSRKNLLGKGLMRMRKQFPEDYKFFPLTWMLPSQYSQFRLYFQSKPKGKARTYIVKPEAMSQGKGIFLTRKIEDLTPGQHYVVQRYMHRPYLIDGLKFDFRIYVLLAAVDPLRIYIYEQGLARFATQTYITPTRENLEEVCMHLTNYAINKDSPNFVFNTNDKNMSVGHKRSLTSVYQLMQSQGVNTVQLKQKINDIIIKTILTGLPSIRHQYRSCQSENYASNMCFQVLGFDILVNHKAQPSLLQINYTPSFTTDTPLDETIKFNLIKDALVLMNINADVKQQVIAKRREECNQRVITGKKPKLTPQQKQRLRSNAQKLRDQYDNNNLGAYHKVYPLEDNQKMQYYARFLEFSEKHYYQSTGIRRKVVEQKPKSQVKPVNMIRRGKSTNTTAMIQKPNKPQSLKLTDTCYYKKDQKCLPLIGDDKLTKTTIQERYEKAKSQTKEQLKRSTETSKTQSKKQIQHSARNSNLINSFTPNIVNNINLNFYFQPNVKQQVHGSQKKPSQIMNPSFLNKHSY